MGQANNGTTIAALNLIRTLRNKGHEVRVVCPDANRAGAPGYYIVPKYDFHVFNDYVEKNGVAPAKLDTAVLESAIHDADVIHVMIPFALGKAAAHYAHDHNIALTAGFHCQAENITNHIFLQNSPRANTTVYHILYERLYQFCDCIHYPTQFIRDTFEAIVGPTEGRVISNGVSSDFHPISVSRPPELEGKYVVLFTGRYSREKSHRVLLDAVAQSRNRDRILREHTEKLGIPMPIMQFYSRKELVNTINMADLYVHPAEIEIEAISCLEAIACGRVPLIADSPRSATRYFALTDQNLFHYNNPGDLAGKMDWWLEHPQERQQCAQDYLGYAHQFDFDTCMDAMEQMLRDAMEAKQHGA